MNPLILVVENGSDLGPSLVDLFKMENFHATSVFAAEAEAFLKCEFPHVIVLDADISTARGMQFLRRIRLANGFGALVVVSTRSVASDRIVAFREGASDIIEKPFAPLELLEKVKIQLRCTLGIPAYDQSRFASLELNHVSEQATIHDVPVPITTTEYRVLLALIESPESLHLRRTLYEIVWGYKTEPKSRALDYHINSLRNKFRRIDGAPRIITIPGRGFVLSRPEPL